MSDQARIDSIDALERLRVSLCRFAEAVRVALAEADSDLSRAGLWLGHEMRTYWKDQVRRRGEAVNRARLVLQRQEHQSTPLGGRYSCVDERKALAQAQRRFEEAERKIANVGRWQRKLEEEAFAYKGVAQGLSQAVESDLPVALARLDKMMEALQAYLAVAPTGTEATLDTGWQAAWTAAAGTPAGDDRGEPTPGAVQPPQADGGPTSSGGGEAIDSQREPQSHHGIDPFAAIAPPGPEDLGHPDSRINCHGPVQALPAGDTIASEPPLPTDDRGKP